MNSGVIYFNQGNKCVLRMLVSIYSLRKHYTGNIALLYTGEQPKGFLDAVKTFNIDCIEIPFEGLRPLVVKSQLWKFSPYDVSLFLDADTIIVNKIDHIFPIIEQNDFGVYWFMGWRTWGSHMSGRINAMKKVCPELVEDAIKYSYAINTGCFGFTKKSTLLKEWEELSLKTAEKKVLNVITDEIACQMLLHKHKHYLMGSEWGISVRHGKIPENPIVWHFHGRKHCGRDERTFMWKKEYWELRNKYDWEVLKEHNGDRNFRCYLNRLKNISIVTAVDKKYLPILKKNYPLWMQTEGIMEYPLICFYDLSTVKPEELDFLGKRTKLIAWDLLQAESQREKMLSAFLLGSAKHVTTPYWLKLDADCTPVDKTAFGYKFEIPDNYGEYEVVSHKWGYTKSMGQGWLNKLEEWGDKVFPNTNRIFPKEDWQKMLICNRYGHRRINSFCHLEKTELTKKIAKLFNDKLVIQSQDTIVSYVLERLKLPYLRVNMHKYFSN